VKSRLKASLIGLLLLSIPVHASTPYANDNAFVEAMLRMMEIFGLIDRDRLPLGVPYLPGTGMTGMTGMPGVGSWGNPAGFTSLPGGMGMTPWTGMTGMPGAGGLPGMGGMPMTGAWPGAGAPYANPYGMLQQNPMSPVMPQWQNSTTPTRLDGIWELNKGGFVIIKGAQARLYVSKEQYQDYRIGYDDETLWWAPQSGGETSRYRYRMQDGRMVLADADGNYLLLRRRR
jgi:hypothetical protein